MSRERRDDELRGDVSMRDFQIFKNGKLNPQTPKGYNYILGYPQEGCPRDLKPINYGVEMSSKAINGTRVI